MALFYLLWLAMFLFGKHHLKMASLMLVWVAKASIVLLGFHKKYIILYQVFFNEQLLFFNILLWKSFDMMII